ncbi:MAG: hypothetical protein ACI8PF_000257 [Flavobacteriaceae bacterium]|jgi:hypothetical protein|tara:strand:- start:941 stop:1732 length:792 start_codon:yes stop_codon:yes gene_type:complete
MKFQGVIRKMQSEFKSPIKYYLEFKDNFICLNDLLDKEVSIKFLHYFCLSCEKEKEIFRQGYCKNCFFEQAQAGDWIIKPELSTAHLNIEDRDLDYEKRVQLQPHIVYLANTGQLKVGVTRKAQVPYRWIDQGAHQAIELVEVPNRYLAGITEVAIKEFISDKTNWRKMLTSDNNDLDIMSCKEDMKKHIPKETLQYFIESNSMIDIDFPVNEYPIKPLTQKLIKTKEIKGTLKGIKGQYLLFEENKVFNVRSHEGFVVEISF